MGNSDSVAHDPSARFRASEALTRAPPCAESAQGRKSLQAAFF
jgi:hypothetical protein